MTITTIEELQRDAPELYRAVINRGVIIERRRVLAHLSVAKYYHSLYESIAEIEAGTPAILTLGEVVPYGVLHDHYCDIEDARCD